MPEDIANHATASPLPTFLSSSAGKFLIFIAVAVLCIYSLVKGLELRRWVWDYTAPIHFTSDIHRGFYWGHQAATHGYLNLYEQMASEPDDADLWLDYAPLRLAIMRHWGAVNATKYPGVTDWQPDYKFNNPVLQFNTAMELLTCVGIFLLVHLWARRSPQYTQGSRGPWIRGLIGALLFWFNPAILQSAHGWPTWDMWVIPLYIWAVFFASVDCWFVSGFVLAIGAMFKGQQFFVAPIFILWPLFLGRPGAALRWLAGLVFGIGAIASPWLVSYLPGGNLSLPRVIDTPAILWVIAVMLAALGTPWILHIAKWLTKKRANASPEPTAAPQPILARLKQIISNPIGAAIYALACIIALSSAWLLIASPWIGVPARIGTFHCLWLAALLVIIAAIAPLRRFPQIAAGALGAALLLCIPFFHGSDAWARVSFGYGTHHWQLMTMGYTSNLPGILKERFHFEDVHQVLFTLAPHTFLFWPKNPFDVDFRILFISIYAVLLLLCAVGIALQARRNDARFLVAITAPWLMFFCFAPQIHERYLIFAAGVGMVTIGCNIGMALLSIFLSLVTTVMQFHVMLIAAPQGPQSFGSNISPNFGEKLFNAVAATYPDIGWAVLIAAGVFLYITVTLGMGRNHGQGDTVIR